MSTQGRPDHHGLEATPAATGSAVTIKDTPIHAVNILAAIVSRKLKKQLSEVQFIRDLCNGSRPFKMRL
ncbi:hypothetical protein BGW80DRAFT_1360707 [Lactifluus volemus]|nr:hypothetical protein BGW80DRAFT_1360707 [Lactifluus volemus]